MASTNGLQNNSLVVNTIDGLTTIYATSIYDNGTLLTPGNYVPYTGATQGVNLGGQELQTSYVPTAGSDVVNLTALQNAILYVGYSHPVTFEPPVGISFDVDTKTRQLKVNGSDVELVGQVAADIRKIRPPEPYKGKGIHYLGEKIRRKAGKTGKGK